MVSTGVEVKLDNLEQLYKVEVFFLRAVEKYNVFS